MSSPEASSPPEAGPDGAQESAGGEARGDDPSRHRTPSFGHDERHRRRSFELEDARWTRAAQLRDWLRLGVMMLLFLAWTMVVYFFEPGLR